MDDRSLNDHFVLLSSCWMCQGLGLVSVDVRGLYRFHKSALFNVLFELFSIGAVSSNLLGKDDHCCF